MIVNTTDAMTRGAGGGGGTTGWYVSADRGLREHARKLRDKCVTQRAGSAPLAARCVLTPCGYPSPKTSRQIHRYSRGVERLLALSDGLNCVVAGGAVVGRGGSSSSCCSGWASVGAADACRQRERDPPACGGAGGASRPGRQSLGDRRAARVALLLFAAPLQRELVTRYTIGRYMPSMTFPHLVAPARVVFIHLIAIIDSHARVSSVILICRLVEARPVECISDHFKICVLPVKELRWER